jgi:glucose/arabinose dehydrogenase
MKFSIILGVFCIILTIAAVPGLSKGDELPDPIPEAINKRIVSVKLETVAMGLRAPHWGTFAPGDFSRLFVVDQDGILWSIDLATGEKTVFLDISAQLVDLNASYDERGFLGIAFHPAYGSNGLLYTYTSEPAVTSPDFPVPLGALADHQSVVTEWRVPNPGDPSALVDPASGRVLLRIDQPQNNHNAGGINFGPDDMLYITIGDGGEADDQGDGHSEEGNGQDPSNVLGTILRIDPLGSSSNNGEYGIPDDNPFLPAGEPPFGGQNGCTDGFCDEIFAFGFRNPFRFSFDSSTGALLAADVGQNDVEEVDIVVAGGNYGWGVKEGSFCFDPNGDGPGFVTDDPECGPPNLIDPVAEYDHDEGIAIIGGFVYRGSTILPLRGRYVFGDYSQRFFRAQGRLFFLKEKNLGQDNETDKSEILELRLIGQRGLGLFLLGFGQDASGELYVLGNSTGGPSDNTGVVLKIVPAR